MQFSKWHGLGNDYLLVERAELALPLTPERVQKICDYHFGVGSDGIVEVLSTNGDSAEVVIWNPDGSTAELSGNGTRIAARWLARRDGLDRVRISVGPREVVATMRDGKQVETEMGKVEVGEKEPLRRRRRAVRDGAGLRRQPARGHPARARARRVPPARAGGREPRAVSAADERPVRASRRPARHDRGRLGARCGGDPLLRHERRRGCERGRSATAGARAP